MTLRLDTPGAPLSGRRPAPLTSALSHGPGGLAIGCSLLEGIALILVAFALADAKLNFDMTALQVKA